MNSLELDQLRVPLLVDRFTDGQTANETGGTGVVTLEFGPVDQDHYWLVERLSVHTGSSGSPTVAAYVGPVGASTTDEEDRVDFSSTAKDDIADEGSPIYVGPGRTLQIRFASLAAGAKCSARMQARRERLVPVLVLLDELAARLVGETTECAA